MPKSAAEIEYGLTSWPTDGEIFTDGKTLFVVDISSISSNRTFANEGWVRARAPATDDELILLRVYYIGEDVDHPLQQTFISAAEAAFQANLKPHVFTSDRFQELKDEGRTPPSLNELDEIDAARALALPNVRALAIAIKSSGGLLVRDLAKQLPADAREQTEVIREAIASKGLVDTEIVIVCRKSQAQVARVPTRDVLRSMSEQGVKCACGRPIAEESIEEALSITDLGRNLLDGNRWLTLLLLIELQHVGVTLDNILIEQQMGGDEIDCLAVISGELVFFELKDKDFNLGNAYSFGAKMGILRPDHAVIFSTQKVGGDAREHFERARLARGRRSDFRIVSDDAQIHYIEGLGNLRVGVQTVATAIYRKDATRFAQRVLSLATLSAEQVLPALEAASQPTACSHIKDRRAAPDV